MKSRVVGNFKIGRFSGRKVLRFVEIGCIAFMLVGIIGYSSFAAKPIPYPGIGPYGKAVPGERIRELELKSFTRAENRRAHDWLRLVAERIELLGFQVNFNPMNRTGLVNHVEHENDYDLCCQGYSGRIHRVDPYELLSKSYHSNYIESCNFNWTQWSSLEIDKLIEKAASEMDVEKRRRLVYNLQTVIMTAGVGEIPVVHPFLFYVCNNGRWKGFVKIPGIGIKNIWTFTEVEPLTEDKTLVCTVPYGGIQLSPWVIETINNTCMRGIYDTLAKVGPDGLQKPWLATEWEQISDTVIDFTIRTGHKFHDGKPVTVEDVKFTYDYINKWKIPVFKAVSTYIKSVEVLSDTRVRFTLVEPFAPVFPLVFARVFIVPKHIWKDIPEKVGAVTPWMYSPEKEGNLIGSGPLKFDYWKKNVEIKQSAYKEHWRAPKYETRILKQVPSPETLLGLLKKGEIDLMLEFGGEPDILKKFCAENPNYTFGTTVSFGYDDFSMHTRRAPFTDPVVRKAIAAVIPKDVIAQEIFDGYAVRALSPISPSLEYWHNPDVPQYDQLLGVEGAKQMLEEAGYWWDSEGRIHYPKSFKDAF